MNDDDRAHTVSATQPRCDGMPEWELFVREGVETPLRHVGSVTAPTPEIAHEHVVSLFGKSFRDVWVCKSSDVERFSTYSLENEIVNAERSSS